MLEAAAILLTQASMGKLMEDADVLLFVDNVTALYSLIKGGCRSAKTTRFTNTAVMQAFFARCKFYYLFVKSAWNIADFATRIERQGALQRLVGPRWLPPLPSSWAELATAAHHGDDRQADVPATAAHEVPDATETQSRGQRCSRGVEAAKPKRRRKT